MITPGLIRRAFLRACQWRPVALQLILLALAGLVAAHPFLAQLGALFSPLPDQKDLTAHLGSSGLAETLLRLAGPGSMHPESGLLAAFVINTLASVVFAGAILAVAASDELLHSRELLEGAGRYYGRLFRMLFAGLIPLAVCGAIAGGVFHWASKVGERAITEHQADGAGRIALVVAAFCYVLAGVWTDLSRAFFVAQPARRSAFFAFCAGTWLMLRRPLRALSIGLVFDLLAFGLAAVLMIARQQITQQGLRVALALLLAQGALALIAWGRAARLLGLVELARADVLARAKPAGTFEMAPPKTSPPPAQQPPDEAEAALAQAAVSAFDMLPPEATQPAPKPGEVIGEIVRIETIAVVVAEPPPDPAPSGPVPAEAAGLMDPSMVGTPTTSAPPSSEGQGSGTGEGA